MAPASSVVTPAAWLRARARALVVDLGGAARGEPQAIHHLRVNARRLRGALPLLLRHPERRRARRLRRALAELLRAAAPTRDFDVRLAVLDELAGPDGAGLQRKLRAARRRAQRRVASRLRRVAASRLRRRLRRLPRAAWPPSAEVLSVVARASGVAGQAVAEALDALAGHYAAEALHDLRIACRRLRYTVELRDALLGRDSGASAALQPLQDALGAIQDLHVLAAWLARRARSASTVERQVALRLRRRVLARARRAHRAWLALEPRHVLQLALRAGEKED